MKEKREGSPKSIKVLSRFTVWILAVALLAVLIKAVTTRPVPVVVAQSISGELVTEVYGTGTLESKVVVGLSSKITGKVVEVFVDQGDLISTGQLLARLDSKDLDDAVRVAVAQLNQTKAELEQSRTDLERQRSLFDRKVISASELDASQTAYLVAQARLETAEAALGVSQAKLSDMTIVSPISGFVIARDLEVGSTVVPGAPIFRIAGSSPWLVAMVDGRLVTKLHIGQPARVVFESNPNLSIKGNLVRLGAEVDRVTEECKVDIAMDEPLVKQIIGQRADVYIETSRRDSLLQMPLTALVVQNGGSGCFTIVNDRALWRKIELGFRNLKSVEIVEGLREGETVILNPMAGKTPITDGTRVKIVKSREEQ